MPSNDGAPRAVPPIVREKLAAFDQIEPAFRESFVYVEQMHGEARLNGVSVAGIVHYLHALFLCHVKDALLSVPTTTTRYDRRSALDLLEGWQRGETLPVIAFLEVKLVLPQFVELFGELHGTEDVGDERGTQRLRHGLQILLNRVHNLTSALETLAGLPQAAIVDEVQGACVEFGHTPDEIRTQREWFANPCYSYMPHPELARRNMLVMNSLGVAVTANPGDLPGERTARVAPGTEPLPSYASNPLPHQRTFSPPPFSTPPYFPTNVPPPVASEGPEVIIIKEP